MYAKIFSAILIAVTLCGCFGPVLNMSDRLVPITKHNGVPFVSARSPIYKEIHYGSFGFDWNENYGFLIPRNQNYTNRALWISNRTQADKLYTVVFTALKQQHYIQKADLKLLQKYLESTYREIPGSKIKRTVFNIKEDVFKGIPAIYVYMETFEAGRELFLREESYFFFDPLQPDKSLIQVSWGERGRKDDWKSPEAENQGRCFFKCFKLLPAKD